MRWIGGPPAADREQLRRRVEDWRTERSIATIQIKAQMAYLDAREEMLRAIEEAGDRRSREAALARYLAKYHARPCTWSTREWLPWKRHSAERLRREFERTAAEVVRRQHLVLKFLRAEQEQLQGLVDRGRQGLQWGWWRHAEPQARKRACLL